MMQDSIDVPVVEVPVLIVGSGAAGTALALELARQGVEARLVDRLPGPSPYSRAVTVHARTLELLENFDKGLVRRFLDRGMHSPGYVMHYVNERKERRAVRPGLDFTALDCRYPFLLIHGQNETEQRLREHLHEAFGHEPQWGVTCRTVRQTEGGVEAELQHVNGDSERLHCRYLVACDGAKSRIREQVGLAQEGSDYAGTVLQNLDVELENFPDDEQWVHYCMGPAHFVMVVKMPGGFFRLLMSQPADKADASEAPQQVFQDILAQHFDGIRFGRTVWHSRWGSTIRLAHAYRAGNVFLAGDAAHVHSTAGGQGMNCCIQDAWNLGWKLGLVLKGQAQPALLDTYETERKPIGKQVIDAASAIHALFMTGRSEGPEALEQLERSGFLADLVNKVSGLTYHYRGDTQAGAGEGSGLTAGDRLPNLPLDGEAGQGCLYDLTRGGGFTLLAALEGRVLEEGHRQDMGALAQRFPQLLRCQLLPHAPASLRLPNGQAQVFLVRPDAYIAAACPLGELDRVENWTEHYLLPAPVKLAQA